MDRQGPPSHLYTYQQKPIQPFTAAHCGAGPVHSEIFKNCVCKIQLGLSGQVVYVCRFKFVSVVFNEVGNSITEKIITRII